jgi:hypothetical protein
MITPTNIEKITGIDSTLIEVISVDGKYTVNINSEVTEQQQRDIDTLLSTGYHWRIDKFFNKRIRISKDFLAMRPDLLVFKAWADLNDLPFEKDENYFYLYCNEVLPAHQPLIDAIESIYVEHIPNE